MRVLFFKKEKRGSLQLIRCISLTIFLLQPEDRIYVNQLEIFLVGLAIHMLNLITIDKTSSKYKMGYIFISKEEFVAVIMKTQYIIFVLIYIFP